MRHLYDLHALREKNDAAEFAKLAREVMLDDAKTYGAEFPAYRDNPLAETVRAADGIAKDAVFVYGYRAFQRDMVYGEAPEAGWPRRLFAARFTSAVPEQPATPLI